MVKFQRGYLRFTATRETEQENNMTNWCENEIRVRAESADKLEAFLARLRIPADVNLSLMTADIEFGIHIFCKHGEPYFEAEALYRKGPTEIVPIHDKYLLMMQLLLHESSD